MASIAFDFVHFSGPSTMARSLKLYMILLIVAVLLLADQCLGFLPLAVHRMTSRNSPRPLSTNDEVSSAKDEEVDVVVIGSGIGGLSCAALSCKYGFETLCLEAHDTAGGCAHTFSRFSPASREKPFRFDSGPSLISGTAELCKPKSRSLQTTDASSCF